MTKMNIDLFGWDTSFGISFDHVNQSIIDQKSTPSSFAEGDAGAAGSVAGTWMDWSFTLNGDGKNINIKCPIKSGSYQPVLTPDAKPVDLGKDGANWVEIEIRLDAFSSDGSYFDKTSVNGSGKMQDYKVKATGGTVEEPVVSVYTMSITPQTPGFSSLSDPEAEVAVFQSKLMDYFKANLEAFQNIFSSFILNAKADKGQFQWLKPTTTDYTVQTTDTMSTSVFAVLAMTDSRPAPGTGNATDPRLLKAANSGAVFAIAKKRFLEQWLKPGVVLANAGTSPDDYFLYSDTLISNNKDLVFKNRVENHAKKPTDLKVPKGNFKIGTFDTQMMVEFEGAHFEYDDGITCELNYVDYYNLSLLPGNGHNALHVTPVNKLPTIEMNMKVAEWREKRDLWIEIGVSLGVSVLGAVLGPALGPLVGKAFGALADTAIARAISAGLDSALVSITEVIEQVAATQVGQLIDSAIQTAADTLGDLFDQIGQASVGSKTVGELMSEIGAYVSSKASSIGQFFMSNRYLIIGGMIGGITGTLLGSIPKIITANEKADVPNMASLNTFTDNAVGAIKWPSGVFKLSSAQLVGVLLLGGDLV